MAAVLVLFIKGLGSKTPWGCINGGCVGIPAVASILVRSYLDLSVGVGVHTWRLCWCYSYVKGLGRETPRGCIHGGRVGIPQEARILSLSYLDLSAAVLV